MNNSQDAAGRPPDVTIETPRLGRLIVVDDEADLLAALCERLTKQGYETVGFSSPLKAYQAIKDQDFDLLLTDMMMPEMDGLTLLRGALEVNPNIVAILMTGQGTIQTAVDALKHGALDYILKPFKMPFILPVLARALEIRRLRLDNLQLHETLAVHELCRAISQVSDVNSLSNKILDAALQQCRSEEGTLLLAASRDQLYVAAARGQQREELIGKRQPLPRSSEGWKTSSRDLLGMTSDAASTRDEALADLSLPLVASGKLIGLLNVANTRRRAVPSGQLKALNVLTSAAAAALESAMLYTEVKNAEAQLRRANEALHAIFQASPLAIVALDEAGTVASWNPAAERLFGWSSLEVVGKPDPTVPPEGREEFARLAARLRAGEALPSFDCQRQHKNLTRISASLAAAPLKNAAGGVRGLIQIMVDVGEKVRLEEQLRQAQKMEAIGVLAGGVAHDFNNLLTVINGYGDLLLDHAALDVTTRDAVRQMRQAGERASALTRQLLDFSRKQDLEPLVISLNSVVAEDERMFPQLLGKDVTWTLDLAPDLALIRADLAQVGQVILNLTVNARDAMPHGGAITIQTRNVTRDQMWALGFLDAPCERYAALIVTDTGVGMDAETRKRIFEPFFTTKAVGKGTGLGLTTVYGVVQHSKGYIEVESRLGQGTSFSVYFPAVEQEPAPRPTPRPPQAGLAATVLLVESDLAVQRLAQTSLEHGGHRVLLSANGDEALRLAAEHKGPIDLLVTDVMMINLTGAELAEKLSAVRPGMKVLFVSTFDREALQRFGVRNDEAALLAKPFSPLELVQTVADVLTGAPANAPNRDQPSASHRAHP